MRIIHPKGDSKEDEDPMAKSDIEFEELPVDKSKIQWKRQKEYDDEESNARSVPTINKWNGHARNISLQHTSKRNIGLARPRDLRAMA